MDTLKIVLSDLKNNKTSDNSLSSNQSLPRHTYNHTNEEKPILLNPENEAWLKIFLYSTFGIEIITIIAGLIVAVTLDYSSIFFLSIIFVAIIHFALMIALNKSFNIQRIKDDVSEIKSIIKSKSD